ncbi:pyruvate:ferredoxin (flavodoxin) oxidoreductase [Kiritimatiella glycovorans]|uniref:Pyruvate-flavodoxin oxidoreductase n=1 Tax=Kiritimatiella glycovorans TaxID=1307763 RepID=A0A0G3EHG4_9BACT|nr:Pyruvate-flavodoxin oxidoreductase [Kiritimatiella glycovorans]
MQQKHTMIIDGNEATARVAHKVSEVCAIYPITPSSPMGEWSDQYSAEGKTNIWGTVPLVCELQSEGGASGSVHGALQTGALTTTFTASQGLLLMLPNMYKIAGELTSAVFHVSARSVACQALSIFGDHSDVMAVRATGFALLASDSVQEAADNALIAQAATLESRIPFVHFFDGFRTSHEINKIELPSDEAIRAMIDDDLVLAHRERGMSPDRPIIRGTAQNPDVFFQARETVNRYYEATPDIVQKAMDRFAEQTGRQYHLFDYFGAPDADRVIVLMGSGASTARATVEHLAAQGEKVGMIQVHLYRPFSMKHFIEALPETAQIVAALDRTKEPGADGEPLYKDLQGAFNEACAEGLRKDAPRIIGGRYGLSSKEFTPAMVKGLFDEMAKDRPKNHFTLGINDDVTHTSIEYDPSFKIEPDHVVRAMFFGLGSDGTVGANKNSIKIIGQETDNYAQGYFVYDSKKAGSKTISHLRFGPEPIRSTYLIRSANFLACHQFVFLDQIDMLQYLEDGGTFLLNSPYGPDEVWDRLPRDVQQQIIDRKLEFYAIDAYKVAREAEMGARINTIMQTCFFAISGVLEREEAIDKIKGAIKKTYGKKGEEIVKKNFKAVDMALDNLHQIEVPDKVTSTREKPSVVPDSAPEFVRRVTAEIMAGRGDDLPVSALPDDGTYPVGTTRWEKRNVSLFVPAWEPDLCIQCGNCSLVCPHSCIRVKTAQESDLKDAPDTLKTAPLKGKDVPEGTQYILQVAVEDCTGCALCVEACPKKSKEEAGKKAINMVEKEPILAAERKNLEYVLDLPDPDRTGLNLGSVRDVQFAQPLFEFSGACAGCGETPYVKLLSQLFGDRAIIANATGCSSIYGGNLPTTPWTTNKSGRGPTWSNSLFEDNAEFGFGFRLTIDKHREYALELVKQLRGELGDELADGILNAKPKTEEEIENQRDRVAAAKERLRKLDRSEARYLLSVIDHLVPRSVWLLGGDGWAYDIGYGGLDHVLASGRNINALVLDSETYSNTGGQMSKATPRAAVAKFAAAGKPSAKKDLGMMAMCYGNVYVARVSMGANARQTLKAFTEAEAYDGPSLIIAYSPCIAQGINLQKGLDQQKLAVSSGYWPLYRFNPELADEGKNPLVLESKEPSTPLEDYAYNEIRYKMLERSKPEHARRLMALAKEDVSKRWELYKRWAGQEQ